MRSGGRSKLGLVTKKCWRRRRDSNPRGPFEPNGFQDRRFQPLTHSSVFNSNVFCELAASLLQWRFEPLHFGADGSKIVAEPASKGRPAFLMLSIHFFLDNGNPIHIMR